MIPLPVLYLLLLLALLFILFYLYKEYVKYKYKGAYFLPTKDIQIKTIIGFLNEYSNKHDFNKDTFKVVDLGSGTGTILIPLIKNGFHTTGFEINGFLYFINYIKLLVLPCTVRAISTLYRRSFWDENFSKYNVIILYGIGYMLKDLQSKLNEDLVKGSIIISVRFPLKEFKLLDEKEGVFFYTI